MGEENGNERYLVNVSKLEKLMEEKRNECKLSNNLQ